MATATAMKATATTTTTTTTAARRGTPRTSPPRRGRGESRSVPRTRRIRRRGRGRRGGNPPPPPPPPPAPPPRSGGRATTAGAAPGPSTDAPDASLWDTAPRPVSLNRGGDAAPPSPGTAPSSTPIGPGASVPGGGKEEGGRGGAREEGGEGPTGGRGSWPTSPLPCWRADRCSSSARTGTGTTTTSTRTPPWIGWSRTSPIPSRGDMFYATKAGWRGETTRGRWDTYVFVQIL